MSGKKGQKKRIAKYNPKIANLVLTRLESGETLTNICKDLKGYSPEQIRGWKRSHNGFRDEYRVAMESGLEALSDKVMDLVTQPVVIDDLSPRDQLLALNNQRRDFINAVHFSVAKGVSRLNAQDKAIAQQHNQPQILVQNYSTKEGTETKVITPIKDLEPTLLSNIEVADWEDK